jgi:hypothetical protein
MKLKHIFLFTAVAMMALFVIIYQSPAAAQEIISDNLFENPGWEAGHHYQDNIPQIVVPNGWRMHWLDGAAFEGTNGTAAYRPETIVWNIQDAPPHEHSTFFRDGIYTFKVFRGWAPMYTALSQDVTGLEVGRKYRISAPIYVDIVEKYEGDSKVAPGNPEHGFVRFGAGPQGAAWRDANQINYSPKWTGSNVNSFYLTMQTYIWDFVATQENMTIFIEMGATYPYQNNAFFMDGVGLYALNEQGGSVATPNAGSGGAAAGGNNAGGTTAAAAPAAQATAAPTPTPRADGSIVHIVGSGDTFWSIAIQYASALGMTPEEALPHIQGLNNNPAFISAGQELLIKEPTGAPVATEAAEEETGEAGGEETIVVEGEAEEADPEATAESTIEPTPAEEATSEPTGICVAAFADLNGDGLQDEASEAFLSDAAITLFRGGTTVSTYITDGISEPHCFENLEADSYEVRIFPPANYQATTSDSWAIAVSEGMMAPATFGVQEVDEAAPADTSAEQPTAAAAGADSSTAEASTNQVEEPGGLFSNIGAIVLVIAIFLVILAGVGVVLLRRG